MDLRNFRILYSSETPDFRNVRSRAVRIHRNLLDELLLSRTFRNSKVSDFKKSNNSKTSPELQISQELQERQKLESDSNKYRVKVLRVLNSDWLENAP